MGGPHLAAIRQIAHEVLRSLDRTYRKRMDDRPGFALSGIQIELVPEDQIDFATCNVGRNAPCPCGSGQRVKHCHGRYPQSAMRAR